MEKRLKETSWPAVGPGAEPSASPEEFDVDDATEDPLPARVGGASGAPVAGVVDVADVVVVGV